MRPDLRLYVLLDPEQTGSHALYTLAQEIIAGGATIVQLRDKSSVTHTVIEVAARLSRLFAAANVPLIINDRVDVAMAAKAQGVHLGQDDMPVAQARDILGRDAIIGLTVRNKAEARRAPLHLLNYVALGGVFATTSKNNPAPPIGLNGVSQLSAIIQRRHPGMRTCAIAGIDNSNAGDVIAAGADGVAVISALTRSEKPEEAARALRKTVDTAIGERRRQA